MVNGPLSGGYALSKRPIDPKEATAYVPPTYTTQREYDALLDQEDKEYDRQQGHSLPLCSKCQKPFKPPYNLPSAKLCFDCHRSSKTK